MCDCKDCAKWYRNGSIVGVCRMWKSERFNKQTQYKDTCGCGREN